MKFASPTRKNIENLAEKDYAITCVQKPNRTLLIYIDSYDNFWVSVGSTKGLCLFNRDTGQITCYDKENGLPNTTICTLIEDDSGYIWICTEGGLSKFNPQTKKFTNFYEQHGLPSNILHVNGTKLDDGRIFASTMFNGIVVFNPNDIKINTIPPRMVLTDIKLFNKSLSPHPDSLLKQDISFTRQIHFSHWQNDISIECAALHYRHPETNQYEFYLENYDKDWYSTGTNRTAAYTNLDPGDYIFYAKGANSDGVWSEPYSLLSIVIHPPWWATIWAYFCYMLIVGSTVYVVWKSQLKRIRLRNELEMKDYKTQKLEEINNLKSRFFANISHEFRTPLTLIQGPIKYMLSTESRDDIKEQYHMILRNTKRLLQLINQLLDFSKLEAGNISLQVKAEDIVPLLKGIVYSFTSLADRNKISLTFNSIKSSIIAYVDRDKFEKIVSNLLSNAFKFTPEGGTIKVNVNVISPGPTLDNGEKESSAEKMLEIRFSDTGIGIPSEHIEHVFDRFYQIDDSQNRKFEGAGIGLALTKELVELHHGQINVNSKPGSGATFVINLPLGVTHLNKNELVTDDSFESLHEDGYSHHPTYREIIKDSTQHSHHVDNQSDGAKTQKPIILITEDNSDVRQYIRTTLNQSYKIIEAQDGEQGFQKAANMIPDLVISDVMMPKMDGFELCKKLKTDERTSHIPVILLTARAGSDSKLTGLETGADDYIIKPFDSKELLVRVKNLIEQRKKLRERFSRGNVFQLNDLPITSVDEKFLNRAKQIAEENLSDPDFSVSNFGKQIGLSRAQLHRKIKALTDLSPHMFIRLIRLQRAAQLLRHNAGNIASVCYQVGFNNTAHFAKVFREQFGYSPSEFSKNRGNTFNQQK